MAPPAGLAVKAGRLAETLTPSNLADMLARTGIRHCCRDKAKWTYFGDAFFNVALRQAKSLKEAFIVARALVRKRELREHFEPSNPLMAGGANVRPLLIAHP